MDGYKRHQGYSTIIFGDLNVHQIRWLHFSRENTPEGFLLESFAANNGFTERICQPTRGKHLLDLFLSDFTGLCETSVLPSISDHMCTQMKIGVFISTPDLVQTVSWNFGAADWKEMFSRLSAADWTLMDVMDVNEAVVWFNNRIKMVMNATVPKLKHDASRVRHPWINEHCLALVRSKIKAEGTSYYADACKRCSEGMYAQFLSYVQETHVKLKKIPTGSKKWWKLSHQVFQNPDTSSKIPPLLRNDQTWAFGDDEKCEAFADTFRRKWKLPGDHHYSSTYRFDPAHDYFVPIRPNVIRKGLKELDPDSATGPDDIPAVVLRKMRFVLERPLTKIARMIIARGIWPEIWKLHWICPLFKKGLVSNPEHYRGIHLTSQVSKIIERLIAHVFITPLFRSLSFYGDNQFAYTKGRGARDALAYFVLSCILAFARGEKVAFYQGDVAGAFDRLDSRILVEKCNRAGLHPKNI